MKKRLLCLVMILGLSVTACGVDADFTLNKDKTYNLATTVYYNESEINQLSSTDDFNINDFKKVKIDGKTYYKSDSKLESGKCSDNEGWYVTDDKVVLPLSSTEYDSAVEFMHTKVTVPFKIGYTNAELVDDNSVKTDKSDSTIFISKSDSVKTGKDLKIKLLSSKKEIKNGKIYGNSSLVSKIKEGNLTVTKPDSIYISSDDSFIESASLNGVEFNPYTGTSLLPILDVNNSKGRLSFETIKPKDGKYTVKAKLISGVEKSCTYYIDTKKPVVKVKAGKLSISDKKKDGYASGIKSITVDGKVSKNGASVKKGSKVVVKDKAGNVTKLTVK